MCGVQNAAERCNATQPSRNRKFLYFASVHPSQKP